MSASEGRRRLRVGAAVAAGVAVTLMGIMAVTSKQGVFKKKVSYFTIMKNAGGLKEGDMVQFNGVDVGFVRRIALAEDPADARVYMYYDIDKKVQNRITNHTRASVKTMGLLGDKYIQLYQESVFGPESNLLPESEIPGDPSFDPTALAPDAVKLLSTLGEVAVELREFLEVLNEGEGVLPRLIRDPETGAKVTEDLESVLANLRTATEGLAHNRTIAGALLTQEMDGPAFVKNLEQVASGLGELSRRIEAGEGALGALSKEGAAGDKVVDELAKLTANLHELVGAMNNKDGMLHKLMADPAYGKRMLDGLARSVTSLESILSKVDRGEGSVGALINDPGLYEDLKDVTAGVSKSRLAKGAVTHFGKKGQKKREQTRSEALKELEEIKQEEAAPPAAPAPAAPAPEAPVPEAPVPAAPTPEAPATP